MKINKFKIFSYIGLGLAAISAMGTCADYASIIIEIDPRIYTAATVANYAGQGLDIGGNYLWNQEIKEQNKNSLAVNFKNKEVSKLEKENWEEVDYWNLNQERCKINNERERN